jgi:hypothetical protein
VRRWVAAASLGLALSGCPNAPPSDVSAWTGGPPPTGPQVDDADGRYSAEEKAQSRGKLGGIWVSCYGTFQPTGDAAADLGRLTAACGRPTGLAALAPVRQGETQTREDPVERFSFQARSGRCYRLFAVASPEVIDLDVTVLGPEGHVVAADVSRDRWPVVPSRGALCIEHEGVHTVEVSVAEGSGSYLLQVWAE